MRSSFLFVHLLIGWGQSVNQVSFLFLSIPTLTQKSFFLLSYQGHVIKHRYVIKQRIKWLSDHFYSHNCTKKNIWGRLITQGKKWWRLQTPLSRSFFFLLLFFCSLLGKPCRHPCCLNQLINLAGTIILSYNCENVRNRRALSNLLSVKNNQSNPPVTSDSSRLIFNGLFRLYYKQLCAKSFLFIVHFNSHQEITLIAKGIM